MTISTGQPQALDEAERNHRAAVAAFDPADPAEAERLAEFRQAREAARDAYDEARSDLDATSYAVTVGDWDDLSLQGRRDLIRARIERVVVSPGRGPDRIRIEAKR